MDNNTEIDTKEVCVACGGYGFIYAGDYLVEDGDGIRAEPVFKYCDACTDKGRDK